MPRKLYLQGWVAGFIYNDGHEWLFAAKDWENGSPFASKNQKAVIHPTKEKAIAHVKLFKAWGWVDLHTDKCFVREYGLETSKEMNLPLVTEPYGEKHFVD